MEVYNVAPCAAWVILSGIYMISGINLFRGKGTHARKIKDMMDGKNMNTFMRIQGCLLTAFGICFLFGMPYALIPVNNTVLMAIFLLLLLLMIISNYIYTGKFWPNW